MSWVRRSHTAIRLYATLEYSLDHGYTAYLSQASGLVGRGETPEEALGELQEAVLSTVSRRATKSPHESHA